MIQFNQSSFQPLLFVGADSSGESGWTAVLLKEGAEPPPKSLTLQEAFSNAKWSASFLFSAAPLTETESAEAQLVDCLRQIFAKNNILRAFVWLENPDRVMEDSSDILEFSAVDETKGTTVSPLQVSLIDQHLNFRLNTNVDFSLQNDDSEFIFNKTNPPAFTFSGANAPTVPGGITSAVLGFQGVRAGCFRFGVQISRSELYEKMNWGFQALIPNPDPPAQYIVGWYPLATPDRPSQTDAMGFDVSIDPSDRFNANLPGRTAFFFDGTTGGQAGVTLVSYYMTRFGQTLYLSPLTKNNATDGDRAAYFEFSDSVTTSDNNFAFHFSPVGDFEIAVDGSNGSEASHLLCGLDGTESISFTPKGAQNQGDRIRFVSRQPAYIPEYPLRAVSPVGRPGSATAEVLNSSFLTSYAIVVPAPGNGSAPRYFAQPKGSSLYGRNSPVNQQFPDLLGHMQAGMPLPQSGDPSFPLFPYSGLFNPSQKTGDVSNDLNTFSSETYNNVEETILSPTRRTNIRKARATNGGNGNGGGNVPPVVPADVSVPSSTPAGILVDLDPSSGQYTDIKLGYNQLPISLQIPDKGFTQLTMHFDAPSLPMQEAFQTNQLFLVMANGNTDLIGELIDYEKQKQGLKAMEGTKAFYNAMNVGEWIVEAKVGDNSAYGNYSNVIIVKGRRGKLIDLVKNAQIWTDPKDFSAPSLSNSNTGSLDSGSGADQIPILSQWILDYIDDAEKQDSPYFNYFNNTIANDPNWTGILVLRACIENIPVDLAGLTAGIDRSMFYAHHFGIQISILDGKTMTWDQPSSVFGLIYYIDPNYDPRTGDRPISPPLDKDYDFRVLTLKVLFKNSAVQDFDSLAQLTMNRFFDESVLNMGSNGNPFNAMLLKGTYQNTGGIATYSLTNIFVGNYLFNSNVLPRIEIDSAAMSTRTARETGESESVFSLSGFLDFAILQETLVNEKTKEPSVVDFDLFSFGNKKDQSIERRGLSFSNLLIVMKYTSEGQSANAELTFDPSGITFDLSACPPRENSLFQLFSLKPPILIHGAGIEPGDKGFDRAVVPYAQLAGVNNDSWYGLDFELDLGTMGDLAGKVGLTSHLLLAWSPGSSSNSDQYKAEMGLLLPGSGSGGKLLSLETVLKLSIGQILFAYVDPSKTASPPGDESRAGYLLSLTNIALKFLGILKLPPNGSTSFYLFGNQGGGSSNRGMGWLAYYKQDDKS